MKFVLTVEELPDDRAVKVGFTFDPPLKKDENDLWKESQVGSVAAELIEKISELSLEDEEE